MSTKKKESTLAPSQRTPLVSTRSSDKEAANPIADYLTRASDTLGRSNNISFTMPPEVRRVAAILIRSEVFPFKTEPDVWRWCINFGLAELSRRSKVEEAVSEMKAHNAVLQSIRYELEQAHYGKHFDIHRKSVQKLVELGHIGKAEQVADGILKAADANQDPYWRKLWRDKAAELVKTVKKARQKAEAEGKEAE